MNNSNKEEFANIMYGTCEIYDRKVSNNLMTMYFESLKGYSIEEVKKGFSRHSLDPKHGSFMPKPADIVRHLQSQTISTEEKAELAWAQIEREIRVTGSWGKLKMDDKQGLAALKAFTSWKDLCGMNVDKMTWAKKEFISMYSTYENTPIEMLPSSLPGRVELIQHKEKGLTCIGDVLKGINERRLNKE